MSCLSKAVSFLIYFTAAAVSVLLIKRAEKKKSKILAAFGILVAVLLATFRESGIDFPTYHHIYDHIHAGGAYPIEWGWIVLNRVAPSYKAMLFLAALIFYGVSYIAIQRFDARYRWMSWLVILSTCTGFFYNGTRQAIASAFVFLGISYFYKKKYIYFAVSVALGALFHKSAWIMLLLLPLYWFVMKRVKKLMLSTVIMSVIALFSVPIVVFAVRKMGIFLGYIENISFNFSLMFLLYTLPPLLLYAWKPSEFKENKMLHFCLIFYIMVIPMQFLGMRITFADRIMLYFRPMLAIAIPLIIEHYEAKSRIKGKNAKVFYVFWFIFYHIMMGVLLNENGMYPYMNFSF